MAKVTYDKQATALIVIDPYNDFISEGGKVWDRLKPVAEANSCVPHMLQVLNAAQGGASRLLCVASSIPPRRLRDLEVHCSHPEGSLAAKDLRVRDLGRRDPQRIRTSTGRRPGPGALVFQWLCQHRLGFAAQEARHSSAHRRRTHRAYVCGGDRTLRC